MIQCSCPECDYTYKVADELVGKNVLCPECKTRFEVKGTPHAAEAEPEDDATPAGKRHVSHRGLAVGMPYVQQSLIPGEQVVHCGQIHWIVSRRTIEMNLAKIENIQVDQSLFGRLFAYGKITVVGTGSTREVFKYVADALEFRRAVQAQSHRTAS